MGLGMTVGVLVARYLGPEKFGLLNFATAFVGIFGAIAGMGLKEIVVRDIVRDPEGKNVTLGSVAALLLVGGLISYGLIIGSIFWLRPDDILAKILVAILGSVVLFKSSETAVYWFDSQLLSKYNVWVKNGSFLFFAPIKLILILFSAPLVAFAWAVMAEGVMVAVLMLAMLSLRGQRLRYLRVSLPRAKSLMKDSWPFMLSGIAAGVYIKIDQIMLGQMLDDEAVGIYSAAVRVSEVWYFIPAIVVTSVFPSLIISYKNDTQLFYRRLQKLYGALVKLGVAVALIMTFASEQLISLIFGEDYIQSAAVLSWHIWGGIFVFFGSAWSMWIALEGLQKTALIIHCMSLIANLALNIILIPTYGAEGAAIATALSYALGHTIFMAAFRSQRIAVKMFWRSFI